MTARQLISVDGFQISYLQAGAGPPLVLLHGIGGNASQFRHQFDALADRWSVYAWDAPGYGESDDPGDDWLMEDYAAKLHGWLDALGLDRVFLLGQSWGGSLAQVFIGRYPERVAALILSDSSMGGRSQPEDERIATLNGRLKTVDSMTPQEMAESRAPMIVGPSASVAALAEATTMMSQIRRIGYRQAAIALAEVDTRPNHATIRVPTLVLAGEHDRITPPERAALIKDAIAGARLVLIPGTGHLSGQEAPDVYNDALGSFLTEVTATTG